MRQNLSVQSTAQFTSDSMQKPYPTMYKYNINTMMTKVIVIRYTICCKIGNLLFPLRQHVSVNRHFKQFHLQSNYTETGCILNNQIHQSGLVSTSTVFKLLFLFDTISFKQYDRYNHRRPMKNYYFIVDQLDKANNAYYTSS